MQNSIKRIVVPGTVIDYLTVGYLTDPKNLDSRYSCQCTCGLYLLLPSEQLLNGKLQCCNWEQNDPEHPHVLLDGVPEIHVFISGYHVRLLNAMLAEGGKGVFIDADFLEKYSVGFRPRDPREKVTDIQFCGFLKENRRGGWTVTEKAKKWLNGEVKSREGVTLDGRDRHITGWIRGSLVSPSDRLAAELKEEADYLAQIDATAKQSGYSIEFFGEASKATAEAVYK